MRATEKGTKMLRPRNDYVALKRDKPEEKFAGGIVLAHLAEDVSQSPEQGVVLQLGPKVTEVKVGDRVLIGAFAGWTFKVHAELVGLIKDGEILAVLG